MINLPKEITDILHSQGDNVRVVDPETKKTYLLVDEESHQLALLALQEKENIKSLEKAAAEADAGGGMSLEEADQKLRAELGFSSRK